MDYGTRPRDPAIPAPSGRSLDDPLGSFGPSAPRLVEARASEIDLDGVLGRVLFPSPLQGAWLPFEALAESRVDGGGTSDPHAHELEEVVNYVLEGTVIHRDHAGASRELPNGSVARLSTRSARRHDILATVGTRARWISLSVRLPRDIAEPAHPFEYATPHPRRPDDSGLIVVPLVGEGSGTDSSGDLVAFDLQFTSERTSEIPVGLAGGR